MAEIFSGGFTDHTEMILEGLNAKHLISKFRDWNIPTDALPELTLEDLVVLGADEELSKNMMEQFKSRQKWRSHTEEDELQDRIQQLLSILKDNRQQMRLMDAFMQYLRLKLGEHPKDYIMDPDKNERASESLIIATKSTLGELKQMETEFKELSAFINERKTTNYRKKIVLSLTTAAVVGACIVIGAKLIKSNSS